MVISPFTILRVRIAVDKFGRVNQKHTFYVQWLFFLNRAVYGRAWEATDDKMQQAQGG